ncbi:hypothetical protein KIPB_009405, partial [Kipferlia bialata]|eukprot:g9405.t1
MPAAAASDGTLQDLLTLLEAIKASPAEYASLGSTDMISRIHTAVKTQSLYGHPPHGQHLPIRAGISRTRSIGCSSDEPVMLGMGLRSSDMNRSLFDLGAALDHYAETESERQCEKAEHRGHAMITEFISNPVRERERGTRVIQNGSAEWAWAAEPVYPNRSSDAQESTTSLEGPSEMTPQCSSLSVNDAKEPGQSKALSCSQSMGAIASPTMHNLDREHSVEAGMTCRSMMSLVQDTDMRPMGMGIRPAQGRGTMHLGGGQLPNRLTMMGTAHMLPLPTVYDRESYPTPDESSVESVGSVEPSESDSDVEHLVSMATLGLGDIEGGKEVVGELVCRSDNASVSCISLSGNLDENTLSVSLDKLLGADRTESATCSESEGSGEGEGEESGDGESFAGGASALLGSPSVSAREERDREINSILSPTSAFARASGVHSPSPSLRGSGASGCAAETDDRNDAIPAVETEAEAEGVSGQGRPGSLSCLSDSFLYSDGTSPTTGAVPAGLSHSRGGAEAEAEAGGDMAGLPERDTPTEPVRTLTGGGRGRRRSRNASGKDPLHPNAMDASNTWSAK